MTQDLLLFFVAAPGLEPFLADEARALGFRALRQVPGGVEALGDWSEVWRANLSLRTASRVLVRVAEFRAMHLAQLDKRARKVDWGSVLRPDVPFRVEATCHASRVYHDKAAAQRIQTAITETLGAPVDPKAALVVKARIDDDLCTISLDTSGDSLHRRGHKEAVGKAPLRETVAAAALRAMGFDGSQAVVDPMCGSGTILLEAAGIAAGLMPGRARRFAFEGLAGFDPAAFDGLKTAPDRAPVLRFFGSDRDQGAIAGARANALRAGLADWCRFERRAISDLTPPEGLAPGIVLINPPWGSRIGDRKPLFALHGAMGATLRDRFDGWNIGILSPDAGLIKATGLPLSAGPTLDMGGTRITLWQGHLRGVGA